MIPINEKEREKIRKQLRKAGNDFLQVVKEEVDSCVLLCDVERLERLTSIVHVHMDSEVIRTLREKGLSKDIRKLCDKAGRIKEASLHEG
jgi:hypothetical protein